MSLCALLDWLVVGMWIAFVSSLCVAGEPVDLASAVTWLLHSLPLLRTSNAPAKAAYLHVLPTVLRRATETGLCLPDCQQILSYALIHPAISGDELIPLNAWQPQLHEDVSCSLVTQNAACGDVVNGPTTSSPSSDRLCNGGIAIQPHRDLSAARSLPVGLLHDISPSVVGAAARPSRTTAAAAAATTTTAGSTVYLQHSSPPPGLPRALTPPRLSEWRSSLTVLSLAGTFKQFWA